MEVYTYPNNLIGTVQEEWSLCIPMFKIKDAVGETVLRIEGPFCTMSCCGQDVEFKVDNVIIHDLAIFQNTGFCFVIFSFFLSGSH